MPFLTPLTLALLPLLLLLPSSHAVPTDVALSAASPLPPTADPFYKPPKGFEHSAPGAILRHRRLSGTNPPISVQAVYQLLYRTQNALGDPSATVTTVLIPSSANYSRLWAYHTAYDQADRNCSPSYAIRPGSQPKGGSPISGDVTGAIQEILAQGIPVSTPDYEGEEAAFTAGPQAAYAVLDAIRAVLASEAITGISPKAETVMFGYSGGSLATEWACEFQAAYAPQLNIVGAAMGGLPVNTTTIATLINGTPAAGLIVAAILGLAAAYPNMTRFLQHSLIPSSAPAFYAPRRSCVYGQFAGQDISTYFKQGDAVLEAPVFRSVMRSAGVMGLHGVPRQFPLYVYKGTADEVTPTIGETDALVQKYCARGATVKYFRYVNGTHESTADDGTGPALEWLLGILNGDSVSAGCTVTDVAPDS